MAKRKMTVGEYLLTRIHELGINHIFGVPGDYNLGFLDQIVKFKGLDWVGTCNELNGSYASDGYARINGMSALVTTFGVGELSALNGIAGAYAEYIPIVHMVGLPSTGIQEKHSLVHHTLGDGRFTVFYDMYKPVTCAQCILTKENAAQEIDRVLTQCWLNKRPVYIGVPSDVSYCEIDAPQDKLNLTYPDSNKEAVKELVMRAAELIEKAKNPVVLIDCCAQAYHMKPYIQEFLDKTGLPFASMNMGKALIDESHPQYMGCYNGDYGTQGLQACVENSDCIISFGSLLTDFNTGGFTTHINANVTVEIHSFYTQVHQSRYEHVVFSDTIPALTKQLGNFHYSGKIIKPKMMAQSFENKPLKHDRLWNLLSSFVDKKAIVIGETGTSLFGALSMVMPDGVTFIGQTLWASIGYSVGALLGACMASPKRQAVLFVGDGSFQLTAQEISTIERHNLTPTIFLIDNEGYTVERVIHGPKMAYNDIQQWDYDELPKVFGTHTWSTTVTTEKELENALKERKMHNNNMALITLKMDKMDAPMALKKISETVAQRNKYSSH